MKEKIIRIGLVGKDVSKSTSDKIHRFICGRFGYRCEYEKISVDAMRFDMVARRFLGDFDGFNVTIPYKKDIMEYLDEINGDAFDFGAVNTVVCEKRQGYNTDGVGFLLMTRLSGIEVRDKKVLVLGGGGAGRSTAIALKNVGANVSMYQRNRAHLEETCSKYGLIAADDPEVGGYDILVNATGVGMHDTVGISPVTKNAFRGASVAIDLIYTPQESEFLRLAKQAGLQILNGEAMLFYQAYYADCLFLGIEPKDGQAIEFYRQYKQEN